jgi:transcription elongation GreA/GreB family factor
MSVAFRRDGDDEHLEPKFEIPIPPGPNLVTARGKALIDGRVAALEQDIGRIEDETSLNAAKRDLRYWQTRQVTAELAPIPSGNVVEFGTVVTILLNGKERVLSLVGDDEADPAGGLLSFTAPLSRALMDAQAGDILAFNGREDAIEVLAIGLIDVS